MIIFFSIFLVVFSMVIIKTAFSEIKEKLQSSKWVTVEGILDNVKKWEKTSSHTGAYAASVSTTKHYISFSYSYEVNGKKYNGYLYKSTDSSYYTESKREIKSLYKKFSPLRGEKIKIFYNPAKHNQSALRVGFNSVDICGSIVMLMLAAGMLFLSWFILTVVVK